VGVRFEHAGAVREFKSYKGVRHLPGRWWTAMMGRPEDPFTSEEIDLLERLQAQPHPDTEIRSWTP